MVLIDEHTSSDGEGVSRGISELKLGRLVGTRTWGGGIWLSSDNHLVDGGIATVSANCCLFVPEPLLHIPSSRIIIHRNRLQR